MRIYLVLGLFFAALVMPMEAWATKDSELVQQLRHRAISLQTAADLTPLVNAARNRTLVLLGEASHGTSEFYTWRADISRRLIVEKGFHFIAVEGDWPSIYQLNRYVRGQAPDGATARSIMAGFSRWPTWMWANDEMVDLIEWLKAFNSDRPADEQVGIYGMDLYGPETSITKIIGILEQTAPDLAGQVKSEYACFENYMQDFSDYARAMARGERPCADPARQAVGIIRANEEILAENDPAIFFNLKQNALVVKHAERHFRAMPMRGPLSWNHRVDHFFHTVDRLLSHYGEGARGIVWAHNTHIGDARATVMANQGQRNIGQIARQQLGRDRVLAVGFGTHSGTVMAGPSWGAQQQVMTVPPAMEGSLEDLLRQTDMDQFLLLFSHPEEFEGLAAPLGHRAIGVVYDPRRERMGNYVPSLVPLRYDVFIYLEKTRALSPIHQP
jgi:erythromycin esterase